MGDSLLQMAQAEPETQFVGIEVHRPGVGRLLSQALGLGIGNLRVYAEDAVDVLSHCVAPASLDAVHIFFPDPWHKKRHHKRRLIQPKFVGDLAHLMRERVSSSCDRLDTLCGAYVRRAGCRATAHQRRWRPP
ncbi:MAG: hypothetical protein CM15mP74_12650 [Halieaceae bacterium]|nr:MAG: hypothetical protein CM15mP74_12650 [Halieaceae bacterium]